MSPGLTIEVRWLNGRFHATPWGRNVNEGATEWPPSPWRLFRALISSWRLHAPTVPEAAIQALLNGLSAQPPRFHLPPISTGHTRHYVPGGDGARLMLDAFTVVDPQGDPAAFLWPELQLRGEEEALLDRLLEGISYLGRSESWAQLRRSDQTWPITSAPLGEKSQEWEIATVLSPAPGLKVGQLLDTTKTLRRRGYSRPPGSAWITYHVPRDKHGSSLAPDVRPNTASFLLMKTVPRSDTIVLANRVRRQLLKLGDPSPTLLGREEGEARQDGHRHLHVLPEGQPRLDRVVLWAPEGFSPGDLATLARLQSLPAEGEKKPQVYLLFGEIFTAAPDHFGRATTWRSDTPYLCARHPKADGRDSPEAQIRRECTLRGLPEPEIASMENDSRFKVHRGRKPAPVGTQAWYRLTFPEPVTGPLCLGASAHFGMGRFVPE